MDEELLQNARIDQLPLGVPISTDFGVYRDMTTGITKRFALSIITSSATTGNFEWTSAKATAGDYDTHVVVTRGGAWYQSTVDNNEAIPGSEVGVPTWTLLTKAASGFVMWAAGVFTEDNVFVLRLVGASIYIFRLKSLTRPYVSSNFETEYAADDWELLGMVQVVELDTTLVSDEITVNFLRLQRIDYVESDQITESKEWIFNNAIDGLKSYIRFSTDGEHMQQLPATVKIAGADNAVWDSDLKQWTPLEAGEYLMDITYMDNQFNIIISGPYN